MKKGGNIPEAESTWLKKVGPVSKLSSTGCFALINPNVIHGLFGNAERRDFYHLYHVRGSELNESIINISLCGSFHSCLSAVLTEIQHRQTVHPRLNQFWIYLPDKKHILYLEGTQFICIDYGHFDDGDTLCVEITGLQDPLHNLTELEAVIESSHDEIISATSIEEQCYAHDPNRCSFCQKQNTDDKVTLLGCAKCKSAYYCNRACQGKHLPQHHKVCTAIEVIKPNLSTPLDEDSNAGSSTGVTTQIK